MKTNILRNIGTAVCQFASGPIASLGNRSKPIVVLGSLIKNATMNPRRGTNLKPWSRRVLLGALLSMTAPIHANLIDLETGDGWHPEWDEDGNPDSVPDWVDDEAEDAVLSTDMPSYDSTLIFPFTPEVLVDQDICLRPASEWITSDPGILVKDAMMDSAAALSASLETWAQEAIEWALSGQDPDEPIQVAVGAVSVNNFDCVTSTPYTVMQCLADGYDMLYCKEHVTFGSAGDVRVWSDIIATIPIAITGPVPLNGTVTIEATVSHRESTTEESGTRKENCVRIVERIASGFGTGGALNATVETEIDARIGGEICF